MLNIDKKPIEYGQPFFAEGYDGLGRIDVAFDPIFKKLAETDESNMWTLNVVSCTQDRWAEFPESALRKLQLTLGYQTAMDALVPDMFKLLSMIATDPWLEYLYSRISNIEHVHCLTEGHEILTDSGYIPFKDLTYNHKIANWNEDGTITFTEPNNIINREFDGDVYTFESNGGKNTARITVTGEHRMPRIQANKFKNRGKLSVVEAKECTLGGYNIPVSGMYRQRKITSEEQLAIAYQADGCIQNKTFGDRSGGRLDGRTTITFTFHKKRKRDRLIRICMDGGIHFTERIREDGRFTISTIISTKYISKDFSWVDDLSKMDFSEDFIQELTYWDGSRSSSLLRYTNTNSYAIEKCKDIAALAGYYVGEYSTRSTDYKTNKTELDSMYYQLTFTPRQVRSGRDYKKRISKYNGKIYCVTVPSSFIVVREAGSPYSIVTGNCLSYSSGITQAFGAEAESFLDIIYTDPYIKHRVDVEIDIGTRFQQAVFAGWEETDKNKLLLIETLIKVFFLEGVKFPYSFFTSWSLNKGYNNCAQGFSQLLLLIAKDEMSIHSTLGSTLLRKLRANDKFKHLFTDELDDKIYSWFKDGVDKEVEWANYLCENEANEPSFNAEISEHFIKYWADRRLKEIKLEPLYNAKKNDIEVWFDEYRNISDKNSALQEIDGVSYQMSQIVDDLHKFD